MHALITGGAGFIGSHIVEQLQGQAHIRVLDNFRSGNRENLRGLDVEIITGSITDRDTVRKAMAGIDVVFHLAALVSVPESIQRPLDCEAINGLGLLNVLEEAAAAGVKKLCFSSSAAVYGNRPETPKREDLPPAPLSPYAITKLAGEYYCDLFTREHGLPTVSLRYFNVFGPRQDPNSAYAAAVPAVIARALANHPLRIYGDGEQTRDFISVRDIAAANLFFALESPATGVFNVACGQATSINTLARTILRLTGSAAAVDHAPARPGDIRHSLADTARLTTAGFTPRHETDSTLAETIASFQLLPSEPRK